MPEMPEGQLSLDQVTRSGDKPKIIRKVTRSALFGAAVGKVVRWTHRDFPEFLTAQCLARLEAGDATALLADPDDPGKIVPQLTGTAVWSALLSRELFDRLMSSEPELLLNSSLADAEPGMRRQLLLALLASMKETSPRETGTGITTGWTTPGCPVMSNRISAPACRRGCSARPPGS
jgi:hypothetical protein